MVIKAYPCFHGNSGFSYRLETAGGKRFRLPNPDGGPWNRRLATNALDLLEVETGVKRKNIRFEVY